MPFSTLLIKHMLRERAIQDIIYDIYEEFLILKTLPKKQLQLPVNTHYSLFL